MRVLVMMTCVVFLSLVSFSLLAGEIAPAPVTMVLEPKAANTQIQPDFIGLSFEMQKVLSNENGKHFFNPANTRLVELFHTLGIKSLRVGGNTADRPSVGLPKPADVDSLFAFARAAGVKVIYTLRLRDGNRSQAVAMAKYIVEHYQFQLACFAIGNEPNIYTQRYPSYRDEWASYLNAITAPGAAPQAKLCGPSATGDYTSWAGYFAEDFGRSGHLAFVSQHDYPGGAGNKQTNAFVARQRMLSGQWVENNIKFYQSFVPATLSHGLPYRLEEVNNFYNGGAKDVSDTFAAALWALDYLHWWAAHGALGVNFHTGDNVAAGEHNAPCRYATFWTARDGYSVHPIGYGIKMFDLGGHGCVFPVDITSNKSGINLTAYGVKDGHTLFVTLINKEIGPKACDAAVTLKIGSDYAGGRIIFLKAPNHDLSATSGVTLGGAPIKDDASWAGVWTNLPVPSDHDRLALVIPVGSAAVVELQTSP